MRGAGGTEGGVGAFLVGLAMFLGGLYLFLTSVRAHSGIGWGSALYDWGGFALTSGMILIPFLFGVAIVFWNARNPAGWLLAAGSLLVLGFGILRSLRFAFVPMSLFDLLVILVLLGGGLGLLLRALRDRRRPAAAR